MSEQKHLQQYIDEHPPHISKLEQSNNKISTPNYSKEQQYIIGYDDVKNLLNQQDNIIRDRFGKRWVKCTWCNEIKPDTEFPSYGGVSINFGKCRECSKKNKK